MYKDELSIFVPNSFLSESKDLKVRTYKVGILGRALAVFRVNRIVIYNDTNTEESACEEDGKFMVEVLNYMNTPQYLRKRAFPIKTELKYVGILPPLRAPHHSVDNSPDVWDYKQGFTVKRTKKGTFVDIGMDKLAFCKEQLSLNKIFSFKVIKLAKEVIVTPEIPDNIYWGYEVISTNKNLKNSLKVVKPDFVVETTRYGDPINSVFDQLKSKIGEVGSIAICFGGPYSSITENLLSGNYDLIKLNTIPNQGTETVRTEEAVVVTLSLFNSL